MTNMDISDQATAQALGAMNHTLRDGKKDPQHDKIDP